MKTHRHKAEGCYKRIVTWLIVTDSYSVTQSSYGPHETSLLNLDLTIEAKQNSKRHTRLSRINRQTTFQSMGVPPLLTQRNSSVPTHQRSEVADARSVTPSLRLSNRGLLRSLVIVLQKRQNYKSSFELSSRRLFPHPAFQLEAHVVYGTPS